jgi:hypothetical protein
LEAYVCSAKEIIPTFCEAQTTLSSSWECATKPCVFTL